MANQALMVALHLGAGVLIAIDFLVWFITLGPIWMALSILQQPSSWARPVKKIAINGPDMPPSEVWRSKDVTDDGPLCMSPLPEEGIATLSSMLLRAYARYADRKAQGIRPLVSWRKDEGFRFEAKVFGPTVYRTYQQLGDQVKAFGSGLRALGLEPQPEGDFNALTGKFKILMYEDTCAEWQVCAQGALLQNIVVATAYATLGVEAVIHAVNEGGITAIVCNRKSVEVLVKHRSAMKSLEAIIYTDNLCLPEESQSKVSVAGVTDVKILSLDEVLDLGKKKPVAPVDAKPESIAVLMYTSGSTGTPKGVIVKHSSLLSFIGSCKIQFGVLLAEGGEMYLGYLPLAHILELAAEMYFYGLGNCVGYADPKTLLAGPEKAYPTGALEEFKPTLMAGVPKVWETIKKGAETKIEKGSPVVQFLFNVALRVKKAAVKQHRYTPVFDLLVFKKFKSMVGGNMKFTLSGGGAISAEVQEWVRAAFGCPLVQGYGLTETCAGATIQHPLDLSVGIAGSNLASIEVALHSEPEITDANRKPYLATDTVHVDGTECRGRGEVWLRGPSVSSGYYKLPDLTRESYDEEGWFHTGDIGLFTPEGHLRIVDRKKNLVKLKGGEYVALEMMNVTYNMASIVNVDAGGICCYADHTIDRPVAIVQCKPAELEALAAEVGVTGKTGTALCRDKKVMDAVKAKLDAVAKAAKLPALMHVCAVMPVVEPWTAANGCLTATQKLVAKEVYRFNKEELDILLPLGRRG